MAFHGYYKFLGDDGSVLIGHFIDEGGLNYKVHVFSNISYEIVQFPELQDVPFVIYDGTAAIFVKKETPKDAVVVMNSTVFVHSRMICKDTMEN